MRIWLPADRSGRRLVAGIVASVLFHVLLVAGLYLARTLEPPVYKKPGEPLLVDIAPDRPKEPAPRGRPDRPVEPERPSPPPRPAPSVASPPTRVTPPPAPRPAPAPPVAKPPEAPSPAPAPQVARVPEPAPAPAPTPERAPEPARADKPTIEARPEQAPRTAPPDTGAPRFGLSKPSLDTPPSIFRRPGGGGGGLKGGGKGGVEGEPIPLDTQDPKYAEYFNQIRERIRAKWIYPREAGDRGIGGQLMIEFHISRDGRLALVELRRSSGVEILDDYALRAIQLAQPFPPVPEGLAKAVLPVSGLFTYQVVGNSFVNQYIR